MLVNWDGLIAILLLLGPLLLAQRALHGELQYVLLLITRSDTATVALFALIFLPGALLHELSHYLMARLLRVRTARFSVLPQVLPGGKLQLGFVETAPAGPLRESLIGVAPLLSGGLILAYIGLYRLGLAPLGPAAAVGDWASFRQALAQIPRQPDFALWFYLAFAVATLMLPSESDRRAWLPLLLWAALLVLAAALAGAGPWLLEHLAPALNNGLRAAAIVFGISLGIHLLLWIPFRLLRALLQRLTGLRLSPR
jgi:hypothetical protein